MLPNKKHLDLDGLEISVPTPPKNPYISPHFLVAAIFVQSAKKNETRASLHDQLKSLRCFFEADNRICKKHGIHTSLHEKKQHGTAPKPPMNKKNIQMFIRIRWVLDQELTDFL